MEDRIKMSNLVTTYRQILFDMIEKGDLDISNEYAEKTPVNFMEVEGEFRWLIDPDILSNLSQESIDRLESVWTSGQ